MKHIVYFQITSPYQTGEELCLLPASLTPAASPLLCVIWALRARPDGRAAIRSRRNPLTDPYSHWVTLALPKWVRSLEPSVLVAQSCKSTSSEALLN